MSQHSTKTLTRLARCGCAIDYHHAPHVDALVFCPLHAQAPAMREALQLAYATLLDLADMNAGPPDYWNGDALGNSACRAILAAIEGG